MTSPTANAFTAPTPTMIWLAVEPESTATAGSGVPPEGWALAFGADASTFMCSDPHASAIWSLPHSRKSNSIRASMGPRNCAAGDPGTPARKGAVRVVHKRWKLSTHPRSSHGAGGASSRKGPYLPGSKIDGVPAVRFIGAKYARICRVTGIIAARSGDVLIGSSPREKIKLSSLHYAQVAPLHFLEEEPRSSQLHCQK